MRFPWQKPQYVYKLTRRAWENVDDPRDLVKTDDFKYVAAAWARTQHDPQWVLGDITFDGEPVTLNVELLTGDGELPRYRVSAGQDTVAVQQLNQDDEPPRFRIGEGKEAFGVPLLTFNIPNSP